MLSMISQSITHIENILDAAEALHDREDIPGEVHSRERLLTYKYENQEQPVTTLLFANRGFCGFEIYRKEDWGNVYLGPLCPIY